MSGTVAASPAASFASGPLSDAEKADIRRFCGYPTYGGDGEAGFQGWRFFQAYGLLEFRMNNLAPAEFQNVRYYLSLLYPVETGIAGMYATLQVDTAASFKRNQAELSDRQAHFRTLRVMLAQNVGVPPGPLLRSSGSHSATLVV